MFKTKFLSVLIAALLVITAVTPVLAEPDEDESASFAVTFAGDAGVASFLVYPTQDYEADGESVSPTGATISRNSDTGEPDASGSGQVNFKVVLKEGYSLVSVEATEGTYKNVKDPSETGAANTYRITKITADTTVTVTTVKCGHGTVAEGTEPSWTWSDDFGTAKLSYVCAACGGTATVNGTVVSYLADPSSITFASAATVGETDYHDVKTAAPFTATFSCDEGVKSINVYYTHDYTAPEMIGAPTAVARDSDTGNPVITGDGQINFTVVLNDGYSVESVTATAGAYKNIKGYEDTGLADTYRITKITADLTVTVTCLKTEQPAFSDVEEGEYYFDAVCWAVRNGITTGTSATEFSPEEGCTRGQVVTFLWRASGEPEPEKTVNPFTDVKESDYFYKAVLWAVEKEITLGTSQNTFSPEDTCTRGQIVTFLYRSEDSPAPTSSANPFGDVKDDDYFKDPVLWAVECGITLGSSEKTFSPNDTCTRGQVVTFLYRNANY